MVTIADVAREAKVSVATVSRVLNNNSRVMPETMQRVEAAIEKLCYEPNILARNFRKNESRVILILAPNITNPYYSNILTGIGAAARRLGYSVMICTTDGESAQELEFLNMLAKKRADGAILLASVMQSRELEKYARQYPIVQCSEYEPGTKIAHVAVDNYKAARQAVDYLIKTGHTRIATISSVNGYPSTRLRLRGYYDGLQEAGIPVTEDYIRYGSFDYSFQSGVVAAEGLLGLDQRPTAIFCISDMLALGAINGAQATGFRVPEDVSILGFDDVEHATMFRPHITTMAQPCYQLGECAAELLYELMREEGEKRREIMLPSELKIRASTKSTGEGERA